MCHKNQRSIMYVVSRVVVRAVCEFKEIAEYLFFCCNASDMGAVAQSCLHAGFALCEPPRADVLHHSGTSPYLGPGGGGGGHAAFCISPLTPPPLLPVRACPSPPPPAVSSAGAIPPLRPLDLEVQVVLCAHVKDLMGNPHAPPAKLYGMVTGQGKLILWGVSPSP